MYIASNNSIIITMEEHTKYNICSYTNNDVYIDQGTINVPFSWEYKPGLSKVSRHGHNGTTKLVLQPPPCASSSSGSRIDHGHRVVTESQISLGLCSVQSSLRISSFRMETPKEEDPFVEAYKKCTKSPFIVQRSNRVQKNNGSWPSLRKCMHILCCKHYGDVFRRKPVHAYKM